MTVTEGFLGEDGVFDELLPAAPLGDPAACTGQDAEAGLVAWQQVLTHVEWRRLRWLRDTARARADTCERWPEPDARIIAAALGWSVGMAASRIELADGALERMPKLGEAMRDGRVEAVKATKFVVGLRDVDDEQARTVVDELIEQAPRLGVYELEQRIAGAVKDVDEQGAENRRNAAVARARVRTRTAPSGAVEIHGMDLDPQIAEPAFERLAAIADEVAGRLTAAGTDVPLSRVQAYVYLRLLHGCPEGNDDLSVADHVTEELLDPPTPDNDGDSDGGDSDDGPEDGGPEDGGPEDGGPDDDSGPDGPDDDSGPDGRGGPEDGGPSAARPDDHRPGDTGPDDGAGPVDGSPDGPGSPDDDSPDDAGPDEAGPDDAGSEDGPDADRSESDRPDPDRSEGEGPGGGGAGEPDVDGRPVDGEGRSGDVLDDVVPRHSATPAGLPDLDTVTGRHQIGADSETRDDDTDVGDEPDPDRPERPSTPNDAGADDGAESGGSPPPWQPGDPPPEPPPDDTADPTVPTGEPPPPLKTRITDRGLEFRPRTLRTSLFTVLGLHRAHGTTSTGALCGADAHTIAWTRTCAQFRILLHDRNGALEWVLLVRPPHQPHADPRYRRQVVELTASTTEIDTLDVEARLVGHLAELARRTQTALAAQRARPPEAHPARTTAQARQRFPGAELARYVQARDKTCRFPMCTVPAVACHLDHTHDWLLDGPTQADNLGALSVGDHLRKHDPRSGWTVQQPTPGRFLWTSPTGTTHTVDPEPYRPLRPIPRARYDHGVTDTYQPRMQRPWRPRTDTHGHITDAARATLDDLDRRRRDREDQPPSPYDDDPPF